MCGIAGWVSYDGDLRPQRDVIAKMRETRIRSFSVDFANHGAAFVAGNFHKSSDTPFVRDFVTHVGCDHTEVVLDSRDLADRDLNRAVIRIDGGNRGMSRASLGAGPPPQHRCRSPSFKRMGDEYTQ
jgi:asparagine synthetase B (glutamine-hydrolysing)